jgi:putative hydroxymethylpyrimidine transport system permease protein
MRAARPLLTLAGLLLAWQILVMATGVPRYMLPAPLSVLTAIVQRSDILIPNAAITLTEIVLGLVLGTLVGIANAVLLASHAGLRRWLLPIVVLTQALPVFALAPLLVLWLGYGMVSKVAMAVLVIFFPVTSAFYDGLRRTAPGWIELARTMDADRRALLLQVRAPAALPAFGSGLRVAAAVAPIGAVIGEWVGSSAGLGYLMLQANARMQTDLMFAALFLLCVIAVGLWFAIDRTLRRLVRWQPDAVGS